MTEKSVPVITPTDIGVASSEIMSRGPGVFAPSGQRLTTPSGRWVPRIAPPRPLTNPVLQLQHKGVVCPSLPARDKTLPPLPTSSRSSSSSSPPAAASWWVEGSALSLGTSPPKGSRIQRNPAVVRPRESLTHDEILTMTAHVTQVLLGCELTEEQTSEASVARLQRAVEALKQAMNSTTYDLYYRRHVLSRRHSLLRVAAPHALVDQSPRDRTALDHATRVFCALVDLRDKIRENEVQPDISGKCALGTTQYCDIFHCCRERDHSGATTGGECIASYTKSVSAVVCCKGRYYTVPFENADGKVLSYKEVHSVLDSLRQGTYDGEVRVRDVTYLGAITALSRERCGDVMQFLDEHKATNMKAFLEPLRQGAFVMVLDPVIAVTPKPNDAEEKNENEETATGPPEQAEAEAEAATPTTVPEAAEYLCGTAWLEKSLNVCILPNGTTLLRGDPALCDDVAIQHVAQHVFGYDPPAMESLRPTTAAMVNGLLDGAAYYTVTRYQPVPPPTASKDKQQAPPPPNDRKLPPLELEADVVQPPTRLAVWLAPQPLIETREEIAAVMGGVNHDRWSSARGTLGDVSVRSVVALQLDAPAFFSVCAFVASQKLLGRVPVVHETITNKVCGYGRSTTGSLMATQEAVTLGRVICDPATASRPPALRELEAMVVGACAAMHGVSSEAATGRSLLHTLILISQVDPSHPVVSVGRGAPLHKMLTADVDLRRLDTLVPSEGPAAGMRVMTSPDASTLHVGYECRGAEFVFEAWGHTETGLRADVFVDAMQRVASDLLKIVVNSRKHKTK
eukprot:PhM_4_TR18189/c0_g4_i1/m.82750